ncbi:hypothetical protein BDZ85DRAFT_280531 [Elsinoe ampelina]|uniref:F-box domain-containing protein n=1 Tax=Elsinoe ampelina TaxID=302913 RepID=A0A6A6GIS4_9PEZI|nr:hypothetical protein BDZ85DRAFT_280531 [Elsinoe ampelina]
MQSNPAGIRMDDFSGAIIDMIVSRCSFEDLPNIRLAATRLSRPATRRLFGQVVLKPTEESISQWKAIAQDDKIRQLPKIVAIWSYPDIDLRTYESDGDESMVKQDAFFDALDDLKRFENAQSVNLLSTPDVCGSDYARSHWITLFEDPTYRKSTLVRLFGAIQARNDDSASAIKDLTFRNLQNMPVPEVTMSETFRSVMQSIEGLHNGFLEDWIHPISSRLKRLSLYDRTNWGILPGRFPAESLQLPELEDLSLGYYTIGQDNQLDWLFRCKHLKRLNLHNVQILSHAMLVDQSIESWSVDTRPWQSIANPDPRHGVRVGRGGGIRKFFKTNVQWATFYDRIANEMPHLTRITIAYGSSCEDDIQHDIQERDNLGLSFDTKRYVAFWEGILPNPWPEADERSHHREDEPNGKIEWCRTEINPHAEYLDEDKEAYNRMVEVIQQRRSRTSE